MSQSNRSFPNLHVLDHPLIRHKLTRMRDKSTGSGAFGDLLCQIAGLMVFEATRSFNTIPVDVETPMEEAVGSRLDGIVTIVPVLRAGLGMAKGILDVMPEARVGHLGMARDEETLEPKIYLNKLPRDIGAGPVVLVDPMLATGGSACAAVAMLREAGAIDLRMMCLVAAPEGVQRLLEQDPEMCIYAGALDERLDERGFILPGLGDAGDRLYGTL